MKICTKCLLEKNIEEFSFKNKTKNILSYVCKSCQNLYTKKHYIANKDTYIKKQVKTNKINKDKNVEYISKYLKEHPCIDCGMSNILTLDFHHTGDKDGNVSHFINYSLNKTKIEMEKCIVLCANCHRIRTANERGWRKLKYAPL